MFIDIYSFTGWTRQSARSVRRGVQIGVLALAAACGGGGGYGGGGVTPPPVDQPPVTAATVNATPSIQFTPATVTLAAGGTITFAFGDVPHNVYFDNAPAGAPQNITTATTNKSVTLTFATPGKFTYNCHIHPGMSGTITVK